jgi:HK97 family phage portal protein
MPLRKAFANFIEGMRDPELTSLELRATSLDNPTVPLSAAGFLAWASGAEPTASGEQINLNTALQEMTVYSCVRVLSEAVASLPLYVFELLASGRRQAVDHPLAYLLRWEPNDEMTAFTFFEALVGAMALQGNAYAEIQRDAGNRPVALWPLHPQLTEPKRAPNGDLVYETSDGMGDGKRRSVLSVDMLHIPLFSFNGLRGFSPIQLARQGIGLARAAEKFGARFFGNGGKPGGILTRKGGTMKPEERQQMRETWEQTQGGENQGRTAVLSGEWTYTSIGIPMEDSQFLQTRQFQRAEIAALFRVPPHYVGDTTRLSGNNAEQQNLQFVTDTLRPYLCRIEAEFLRKLMPQMGRNAGRYSLEFDVSERLRGDFKTTMEGYATGKQWGFFTTNDVLIDLGRNPIGKLGDVYLAPVNMQNAEWLLETESIQDQPLVAPLPPISGDEGGEDEPPVGVPTPEEKQLLGRFIRGYIPVFCDAFQRLLKRNHRDYDAIRALLGPIFQSIADASMEFCGSSEPAPASIVEEVCKAGARRAVRWAIQLDGMQAGELAREEFLRSLRSIHVNVSRDCAAKKALAQLAAPEEDHHEETA